MKKKHTLFYHILIFVLAQVAWLILLGMWIYWYVSNYMIMEQVGSQLSNQVFQEDTKVFPFVIGLILLVGVSFGMSMTFRHLNVQLRLTKMYDNFIANMTHELKSPLSSIQLYLETMNVRDVPKSKQKEFIGLMIKDVDRLKRLINSILEVSMLEQKKISHDYHVFEAEQIVKKLLDNSAEQFKVPTGTIKIEGSAACKCVIDPTAFKMVLDNLIDNSIKYTTEVLQIKIKLSCTAQKFLLEFSDNGVGISAQDQKEIFNKFHRIYNENIPNVKGTGLGLYWVKEIIKSHGGVITVTSEGFNKGTVFKIELPVYKASIKMFAKKLAMSRRLSVQARS